MTAAPYDRRTTHSRPSLTATGVTLAVACLLGLVLAQCGAGSPGTGGTPPAAGGGQSGITGQAVAGPRCPSERIGQPCPPQPVAVRIVVQDLAGHDLTAFQSDQDGRFRVPLAPGDYILRTNDMHAPMLKPERVTVVAGQFTELWLLLDTGIR